MTMCLIVRNIDEESAFVDDEEFRMKHPDGTEIKVKKDSCVRSWRKLVILMRKQELMSSVSSGRSR